MAATSPDSLVRILHLSDFHFSTRSQWDSDPILRALARFIAEDIAQNNLYPDLVVITGDLAQSGQRKEYDLARQWLDALWPCLSPDPARPLARDRLLLVPGNHDVDWDLIEPGARDAHQALLDTRTQEAITDRFKGKTTRDLLLKRHTAYLKFHGAWLGHRQALPWWQHSLTINGQRLHIAGLDSAWLAGGDDDSRLLLGTYQINQTVLHRDSEADCDWRIALLHHPWASLAEFDRNDAQRTLYRHRDLILRGHLHQPDLFRIVPPDPRRACIEAAAGCCYSGKPYPNAFQWIDLYSNSRRIVFHFRHWNQDDWQVDRNQHGCPNGTHTILLPTVVGHGQIPVTTGSIGHSAKRTELANRPPESPSGTQTAPFAVDQVVSVNRDPAAERAQPQPVSRSKRQTHVFISYAQYDQGHSAMVLALAKALADDGIAVELDQFHSDELLHWPRWCEEQLRPEYSDFVLMICSAEYRRRIQNQVSWDEGRGVFWEGQLIYNALYMAKANNRYIPVLLDGEPLSSIPDILQGWTLFRPDRFGRSSGDPEYRRLLRLLSRQPASDENTKAAPPEHDEPAASRPRPATLPEVAAQEIVGALVSSPSLCSELAKELAAESIPAVIAGRLTDPAADFLAVLDALDKALDKLARPQQMPPEGTEQVRQAAFTVLGWTTVATVADGYEQEDARLARCWRDGAVLKVPLGRGPCVEVLTARWRGGKAEFGIDPETVEDGPDNLVPAVMQELGFDDPQHHSPQRAVDAVINRIYQLATGRQANDPPSPARRKDADSWLRGLVRKKRRRPRLVVDLLHPLAERDVLKAIHAELPDLLLILVNDQESEDPSVFILTPADLSTSIRDCLVAIRKLP